MKVSTQRPKGSKRQVSRGYSPLGEKARPSSESRPHPPKEDGKAQGRNPTKEDTPYIIPGFHGVQEGLKQKRISIREIWIAAGKGPGRANDILRMALEADIPVYFKKASELSQLLPGVAHQGIVALADKFVYSDLNQLIETSVLDKHQALLIAADHITDEGNLGSLIRTSAFFGAHGLIIPKDRSAHISTGVLKRSSGACLYLPVAKVTNMGRTLDLLDKKGLWIIGAAADGLVSVYEFDWNRELVLVLGNEQRGLSKSVLKRCHQVVKIPSQGNVESLNVSVAGGAVLSEVLRQRSSQGRKWKTREGPGPD